MLQSTHCAKPYGYVYMSDPTRRELVIEAHRTFGETPAHELASHLGVPFDGYRGVEAWGAGSISMHERQKVV